MILHCSEKLARRISASNFQTEMATSHGFGSWHGHLAILIGGSIRTGIQEFEYGLWHQVQHVVDLNPITASAYLKDRPTNIRGQCLWPRDAILVLNQEIDCGLIDSRLIE